MVSKSQSVFLKIITVDDSALIAERIACHLADDNRFQYMGNALNILSAHKLIAIEIPDVVILDIHLTDDFPKANGINLLVDLKKKFPKMIVIMLTNLSESHYRNNCIKAGADYFFDKSADFEKMLCVLNSIGDQMQQCSIPKNLN